MKLLTREIQAVPAHDGPGEDLPEVPDFACATCGAGMAADQDWCLECGAAAPGRLGTRPGWRAALTVTSLTVLLVLGAVVAAYAALSSDAEREAGQAGGPNGAPIQAQVPPAAPAPGNPPAGAVPPDGTLPQGAAGEGAAAQIPSPSPVTPPSDAPALPDLSSSSPMPTQTPGPSSGGGAPGSSGGGSQPSAGGGGSGGAQRSGGSDGGEPPVGGIDIGARASTVYDPYDRKAEGAEYGVPGDAHDGNAKTVWDVTTPADGDRIKVGLRVVFDRPRDLRGLRLVTPTPGFTVEVYGAEGTERPADILDKRWKNLAVKGGVRDGQSISLDPEVGRVRQLLLWFTKPANPDDPRVAIGEIRLRGR